MQREERCSIKRSNTMFFCMSMSEILNSYTFKYFDRVYLAYAESPNPHHHPSESDLHYSEQILLQNNNITICTMRDVANKTALYSLPRPLDEKMRECRWIYSNTRYQYAAIQTIWSSSTCRKDHSCWNKTLYFIDGEESLQKFNKQWLAWEISHRLGALRCKLADTTEPV